MSSTQSIALRTATPEAKKDVRSIDQIKALKQLRTEKILKAWQAKEEKENAERALKEKSEVEAFKKVYQPKKAGLFTKVNKFDFRFRDFVADCKGYDDETFHRLIRQSTDPQVILACQKAGIH